MRVRSAAEWREAGLTQAQLRSMTRSGDLVRVWHAVYATRSAVEWSKLSAARAHALVVMAAAASVGRDSVASHQSAARIHGLDLFPAPQDIVTVTRSPVRKGGRLKSEGIFFHTAALPDDHVTRRLGACVTTVPRTVVDLARTSPFMSAVVTADSALRAGLTTQEGLRTVCHECPRWPGIRQARRVVDFANPGAESVLESCARVVFHEQGLEAPELQFTVTGPGFRYSVDFYWPKYRVIAEADGAIKYADQRAAIRQLNRDQQLRDLGYKVVHFTWRDLFQNPEEVIARIRKAFASLTPV
jgi:very-short-patch-repair endonuclease